MRRYLTLLLAALLLALLATPTTAAGTVHAVMFYSPNCGHCHKVINEDLPPLQQQYGDQLRILLVNVDESQGGALYRAAITRFTIPESQRGVPTLIVADTVLVGSVDIPQRLPGLIETLLARGGSDWPAIPGLLDVVPVNAPPLTPADTPADSATVEELPPFLRDMPANALAVLVLAGMVVMVIWAAIGWARPGGALPGWRDWMIPLLSLAGLGVAVYLAFIETTGNLAVCGPVGDCNAVQQSQYAYLFGVLPIGVAGVIGYGAILGAWALTHAIHGRWGERAALTLPALALAGTLFSIYLTFLEPFVIGATCAWCLTSAVIITALLWLSMPYRKHTVTSEVVTRHGRRHGTRRGRRV